MKNQLLLCISLLTICKFSSANFKLRRLRDLLGDEDTSAEEELIQQCSSILSHRNAQFFEENVVFNDGKEQELVDGGAGLVDKRFTIVDSADRLERIARALRSSVYAPKLCDPESFVPRILDQSLTCAQICHSCVPGSAPVCHQRNSRFPGVAQTCFCTYDMAKPLHNAVLVLRNGASQL